MKSQIIYQGSGGFMVLEIILSFSLFILFTVSGLVLSSSMQELKVWSLRELDKMYIAVHNIDTGIYESVSMFGNDTNIVSNSLFELSKSNYKDSWGRSTCNPLLEFKANSMQYFNSGFDIGVSNKSTALEVRNDYVYITADSSTASMPDFYIINNSSSTNPSIVSYLNTGPGINDLEVAGPYAFVAQASTVNQLQIIDIHNRFFPQIISQLKLPLPTPTTTAPFATSIFYSNNYIYIGTAKWAGAEFFIIDVSDIKNPFVMGQFETNTLINDIYVKGSVAYLAGSDDKQLRVLDISNKTNPVLVNSFSPSGWQTQEGKTIDYFEGLLDFGRTVGGFNVITNYETFLFDMSPTSPKNLTQYIYKDIPGGVYGLIQSKTNIFIASHDAGREFQVFDSGLRNKIFEMSLGFMPNKMACDRNNLYFATGNSKGFSIIKFQNE